MPVTISQTPDRAKCEKCARGRPDAPKPDVLAALKAIAEGRKEEGPRVRVVLCRLHSATFQIWAQLWMQTQLSTSEPAQPDPHADEAVSPVQSG